MLDPYDCRAFLQFIRNWCFSLFATCVTRWSVEAFQTPVCELSSVHGCRRLLLCVRQIFWSAHALFDINISACGNRNRRAADGVIKHVCCAGTTEISFFAPYTSGEEPIILQFYFPRAHISPPFILIVKRSHAVLTQEIETRRGTEIKCNCMLFFTRAAVKVAKSLPKNAAHTNWLTGMSRERFFWYRKTEIAT